MSRTYDLRSLPESPGSIRPTRHPDDVFSVRLKRRAVATRPRAAALRCLAGGGHPPADVAVALRAGNAAIADPARQEQAGVTGIATAV